MPGLNLITDVPGILIGNAHDETVISGVTAALIERPNMASVITRGGAPGTRDTTLLEPEMTVEGVDGIVLSGGSVYGLDAAGGVLQYLRENDRGLALGPLNVPIVPQAITFDLLNGGNKNWGRQPLYWELGLKAAEASKPGKFPLGTIGGGYGATTANLKGGLGSTSTITQSGHTVGALVVVNAMGSTTVGEGPAFWSSPVEEAQEFGGHPWPNPIPKEARALQLKGARIPATTIAIIATDATLTKSEVKRLAHMADDGLARAIRPAHAAMDGDTVFALATQRRLITDRGFELAELSLAAADCLSRAIARGVYSATIPPGNYIGPPAFYQLHS